MIVKRKNKQSIHCLILSIIMLITMIPTVTVGKMERVQADILLSNPRIVSDSSMESGQKVTWDCVWFGSYPQAEVVSSEEYTALDSSIIQDGDIIVSDSIYMALENATGWDANGDIALNGEKYRRMEKSDATNVELYYYNWSDSTTYHYFKYQPIKWRVLNVDGNGAFLLADKGLDDQEYNKSLTNVTWETSTIRSWLNGYSTSSNTYGTDYSNDNFIDTAFSALQ